MSDIDRMEQRYGIAIQGGQHRPRLNGRPAPIIGPAQRRPEGVFATIPSR
ncbi:MAG TPA: hypothetical protein VF801_11120 [Rhodocyclaceae bacterium]